MRSIRLFFSLSYFLLRVFVFHHFRSTDVLSIDAFVTTKRTASLKILINKFKIRKQSKLIRSLLIITFKSYIGHINKEL